jgi:hypothetical protein
MHPAHEARMNIACGVRKNEFAEGAIDLVEVGWLSRQALAKLRAHHVWDRLPNGALADRRDIVDHIVEHAVRQRACLVPAFRVERFTSCGKWSNFRCRPIHATRSRIGFARRSSIAANALKIFCICGGL